MSRELKKATEDLHSKMLILQKVQAAVMQLKTEFVNAKSEEEQNKIKTQIVAKRKELKAAELAADKAEKTFNRMLASEPEDVEDLLDHKIQEQLVRKAVRKLVRESLQKSKFKTK